MRLGIVSDIHGNLESLKAVMGAFDSAKVDKVLCLGDMIGYFHQSLEVLDIMMGKDIETISGNHEALLLDMLDKGFHPSPVYNLEHVAKDISDRQIEWIRKLPDSLRLREGKTLIGLFHGSVEDPANGYVYEDKYDFSRLADMEFNILLLGHTHRQMCKVIDRERTVLNPGSCGLPRGGDWKAECLVIEVNSAGNSISFRKVEYDAVSFLKEAKERGVDAKVVARTGLMP